MKKIQNALIESVKIDDFGRDLLTAWLMLDYGNGQHQGFGGYTLYLPPSYKHHKLESPAGHFIYRCMQIAGARSWDDIAGKSIRVEFTGDGGLGDTIAGIGHITKDDWFYPEADFLRMKAEA